MQQKACLKKICGELFGEMNLLVTQTIIPYYLSFGLDLCFLKVNMKNTDWIHILFIYQDSGNFFFFTVFIPLK